MQNTGVYTNPLIEFADKKGIALSLNSPLDIKHSMGIARGKNDAVDAGRIAEYAHNHRDKLRLYEKPSEAIIQLQYLLTERRHYMRQRTALINLNSAMCKYETPEARTRNESAIHHCEKLVKKVEEQMMSVLRSEPIVSDIGQIRSGKILVRDLETSRFQQGDVLGRVEIGLCEGNRSHIDKKRPTDLSIAKRLGGFFPEVH